MSELRTVEIDLDVHKKIEMERRSFDEKDYVVLRRLLGLNGASPNTNHQRATEPSGRAWSDEGVELPHGTKVRMRYRGKEHFGEIEDGEWVVEGGRSASPSGAARDVAITKKREKASLNGWDYWYVKRPGDKDWITLSSLRPRISRKSKIEALTDDEL